MKKADKYNIISGNYVFVIIGIYSKCKSANV